MLRTVISSPLPIAFVPKALSGLPAVYLQPALPGLCTLRRVLRPQPGLVCLAPAAVSLRRVVLRAEVAPLAEEDPLSVRGVPWAARLVDRETLLEESVCLLRLEVSALRASSLAV